MGYSYGQSASGRWALSCDHCGTVDNVRKRTCPYKVIYAEGGAPVAYCYPPAYCPVCYKAAGGMRGIHGDKCRDGAQEANLGQLGRALKFAAGDLEVKAAWSATNPSWPLKDSPIPEGYTGVLFTSGRTRDATRVYAYVHDYNPCERSWLSDYPHAQIVERVAA